MKPGPKPKPLGDRILANVEVTEPSLWDSGCWIWQRRRDNEGYGYISVPDGHGNTSTRRVHRVAYELMVGPIPTGLVIDHLCETPACVNPEHMEPVTNAENMRRRSWRMTACRRGHVRHPENTRRDFRGRTVCLICTRDAERLRAALEATA